MATERKKRKIRLFKFNKSKPKKDNNKERPPKPRKPKKETEVNEYEQTPGSKLKVINGTRKRNRIIRFVVYAIILAIVIALIIINIMTPTGIVEALQNAYNAMGEGTYPVSVYSTNALNYTDYNGMQGVVNESFFELYNSEGKLIQAVSHGMSKPQLEVSEARYLLYDRDRYTVSVYNYGDELYTLELENAIMAADIGRDGTFAVVTDSKTYQSTVNVYNKDNEVEFTWNSANYYVTDVAVADDGERIAVSLINANGGAFESFVYILEFGNAEPIYRYKFNDIVSSLTSCGENYLVANGFDCAFSVPWNSGAEHDIKISGIVRCYDFELNGASVIISGREDNAQINTVTVINAFGSVATSFEFNAAVNDVCINETLIAVLTDNEVYVYDHLGNAVKTVKSSVKGDFVGLSVEGDIYVLDSSKLISLEQ